MDSNSHWSLPPNEPTEWGCNYCIGLDDCEWCEARRTGGPTPQMYGEPGGSWPDLVWERAEQAIIHALPTLTAALLDELCKGLDEMYIAIMNADILAGLVEDEVPIHGVTALNVEPIEQVSIDEQLRSPGGAVVPRIEERLAARVRQLLSLAGIEREHSVTARDKSANWLAKLAWPS